MYARFRAESGVASTIRQATIDWTGNWIERRYDRAVAGLEAAGIDGEVVVADNGLTPELRRNVGGVLPPAVRRDDGVFLGFQQPILQAPGQAQRLISTVQHPKHWLIVQPAQAS